MIKKTCFVISPIGDKDSDIRKLADDLFDLIIEPALDKFDFDIIRADKITTSSSITTDIITLVQNSDLCIVDLTGRNPNVMYECGRRHETGKPFIMVARDGEQLPFDVNTIRTFFYNTSDGRSIREISKTIQEVVRNLIAQGFAARSSGESLTTISDTLRRIERKLEDVIIEKQQNQNDNLINAAENLEILDSLTPIEAYHYALKTKDRNLAVRVFPLIVNELNDIETALLYSIPIADRSELAANIIEKNIMKIEPSAIDIEEAFERLIHFWVKNMKTEKLQNAIELTEYVINYAHNNENRASIINQLQRMYFVSGDYENSLKYAEETIKLWKDEASYWFNLAMINQKLNKLEDAEKAIIQMLRLDDLSPDADSDHLELAIKVYRANNKKEEADSIWRSLMVVNKYKGEMLKE